MSFVTCEMSSCADVLFSFFFPPLLFLHFFFKRNIHRVFLGPCHDFRLTWCVGSQEEVAAVNQVVLRGDTRRAANCISQKDRSEITECGNFTVYI